MNENITEALQSLKDQGVIAITLLGSKHSLQFKSVDSLINFSGTDHCDLEIDPTCGCPFVFTASTGGVELVHCCKFQDLPDDLKDPLQVAVVINNEHRLKIYHNNFQNTYFLGEMLPEKC